MTAPGGRATAELAAFVRVDADFIRAVNVIDADRLDDLPHFKVTPKIVRALAEITDSIRTSRDRAWAVVGPYGAGKSMFGILLSALLSGRHHSKWVRTAIEDLKQVEPGLAGQVDAVARSNPCVPVFLQGGPQHLGSALLERLAEVNESVGSVLLSPSDSDFAARGEPRAVGPHDAARLIQRAARNARKAGYAGLVILVDEFGRFLDPVTNRSPRENLAVAQELAELGPHMRRGEVHLFVLLHQNFDDYAVGVGTQERAEWSKIQGRFRQIALLEDPDNLYDMVARCIHIQPEGTELAQREASAAWKLVREIPPFARSRTEWEARLPRLFPLHPLAVYCLPRLSSLLGQNERTIFSFLLSDEPHGLRAYLGRAPREGETTLLGLDWLCDYFLFNQLNSFIPMRLTRQLAQLAFALEQVSASDELTSRIVKVVGALELVRSPEVRPTEGVLAAALGIRGDAQWERFRLALRSLVDQRVLVERRYAGEFRLLPGSDVDLTDALSEAADRWRASRLDLGALLNDLIPLPRLVARRHSFETGTVRGARRTFLDASALARADWAEEQRRTVDEGDDIPIVYVLCTTQEQLRHAERWVRQRHQRHHVLVVPRDPLEIQELLVLVKALEEILGHQDVRDDPVSKHEAELHQEHVRSILTDRMQPILDPGSGSARWFWGGRELPLSNERDVQSLISTVCDRIFDKSPIILSELVNRQRLSTSSIVAVKKVVSGLLETEATPGLGFKGNGPEVTIFHAVFERTGWHRAEGTGSCRLTRPRRAYRLGPAWRALHRFLDSTAGERRCLSELWIELARPPYGIRAGLAPLLIWGALIERRGECCLFDRGTYVANWSAELYDRFIRAPEAFEARCLSQPALAGILGSLGNALPTTMRRRHGQTVKINDFLQELFAWYRGLPDYTKRTSRISTEARAFRHLLSTATDPVELVLRQLPEAFGLSFSVPTTSARSLGEYGRRFGRVVQELSEAYPTLLNDLVRRSAALLGSPSDVHGVHAELKRLSDSLSDEITDAAARAFLLRASASAGEPEAWTESLAATILGQAPKFWTDESVKEFEERVALLVQRIRQTEKALVLRAQAGLRPGTKAKWLTLAGAVGPVIDDAIPHASLSPTARRALSTAEAILEDLMAELDPNQRRQVLAQVIEKLWRKE